MNFGDKFLLTNINKTTLKKTYNYYFIYNNIQKSNTCTSQLHVSSLISTAPIFFDHIASFLRHHYNNSVRMRRGNLWEHRGIDDS